jgi:hypothetical protein
VPFGARRAGAAPLSLDPAAPAGDHSELGPPSDRPITQIVSANRAPSPASGLRVIYLLIGVPLLWLGLLALASGMVKPGGAFTVVGGILGTGALTATRALDAERRR